MTMKTIMVNQSKLWARAYYTDNIQCTYQRDFLLHGFAGGAEVHLHIPDNHVVRRTGSEFGHGLYGDVFEVAYQRSTICAAKKYRHIDRATMIKVFGQEGQLCSIQHANLVAYFGIGSLPEAGDTMSSVAVMERMDTNLGAYLEDKTLSLPRKRRIVSEVVLGLNHLHSQQPPIVHGRLCETNVLISIHEVAKIADYGNCFIKKPELSSAAQAAVVAYMPPEAFEEDEHDEKLDIFSLGHLTIYIVNQLKPHKIKASTHKKDGRLCARTEFERRTSHIDTMKANLGNDETHPLINLVKTCLENEATARPSCQDILKEHFPDGKLST